MAQNDKEKYRPKTELKIADYLFAQGSYYSAADYYSSVIRQKPENRYAIYWLAESYDRARNYEKAEIWYKKFIDLKGKTEKKQKKMEKHNAYFFALAEYNYGVILKRNGKYELAKEHLEHFANTYQGEDDTETLIWKARALKEMQGCDMAMAAERQKIRVDNLGSAVNKQYGESSPFPMGDTAILFASLDSDTLILVQRSKEIIGARFYQSFKNGDEWSKGKPLPETINDEKFITGNGAFNPTGNRFYFTKCAERNQDEVLCHLYMSTVRNGKTWSEPEKLNNQINDPNHTSTQPTVRAMEDGTEIVYFISDRDGGAGGMDIWYFIRTKGGDYRGPRHLKGPINTIQDELTPCYDNHANIMYFSSNGHPNFGGLDVFRTLENEDMTWAKPTNIGYPINSGADDIYYSRVPGSEDGAGYLVSNRIGTTPLTSPTCCDDIWRFENYRYGLQGLVFRDGDEDEPISGATLKLYTKDPYGNEYLVEQIDDHPGDEQFFFKLQPNSDYRLVIERSGYANLERNVSTNGIADEDTIVANYFIEKAGYVSFGNILGEAEDGTQSNLSGVRVSLIEVDPTGKEEVLKSMIQSNEDGEYAFSLPVDKDYRIKVNKTGYFSESIPISTKKLGAVDTLFNDDIIMMELIKDKAYTLSNIYYDYNSAKLTAFSKKVLDTLSMLLNENPELVIELSAHTDSKGSPEYNKTLSQERAESCVNYLNKDKGIEMERLVAKGYGEDEPLVPNTNEDGSDNPDNRARNRRTEFKIIGELEGVIIEEKDRFGAESEE